MISINYTYLKNVKKSIFQLDRLDKTYYNLLAYFLTIEVKNNIEPWIEFLNYVDAGEIYGNVLMLKKTDYPITYIYWHHSRDKKDNLMLNTKDLIFWLKQWGKIIKKQPKGIFIDFPETCTMILPDLNENPFQAYTEEIIRCDPHDEYSEKIEQLCINQKEIKKMPYFNKRGMTCIVVRGNKAKHPDYETSNDLYTIEDYLSFISPNEIRYVKTQLAARGYLGSNGCGAWKEDDVIKFAMDWIEEGEDPVVIPVDKCMNLFDQWKAIMEIPFDKNEIYLFADEEYNFVITCVFSSKKVLTTLDLEKIQEINEQYLYKKNNVQSIYFAKQDHGYEPSTPYLGNNFDCLALLINKLDNEYWKVGLADHTTLKLEDDGMALEKDKKLIHITQKSTDYTYRTTKEQFYAIIAEWYHAIMQEPIGILLLFKNDRVKVIPDFGRPAQIPQNIDHVYLPAEKLYTPRVIDDREYATQSWPEDMSETLIETKIQEAFDYIKNNNIQPIWDPYLKINNFYGYTNDGLLIQYIFDEHMQYIVSVPIFLGN